MRRRTDAEISRLLYVVWLKAADDMPQMGEYPLTGFCIRLIPTIASQWYERFLSAFIRQDALQLLVGVV